MMRGQMLQITGRTVYDWARGCGHEQVAAIIEQFCAERDELKQRSWRANMSGAAKLRSAGRAVVFMKRYPSEDYEDKK